jgi:hypothetical protein
MHGVPVALARFSWRSPFRPVQCPLEVLSRRHSEMAAGTAVIKLSRDGSGRLSVSRLVYQVDVVDHALAARGIVLVINGLQVAAPSRAGSVVNKTG